MTAASEIRAVQRAKIYAMIPLPMRYANALHHARLLRNNPAIVPDLTVDRDDITVDRTDIRVDQTIN